MITFPSLGDSIPVEDVAFRLGAPVQQTLDALKADPLVALSCMRLGRRTFYLLSHRDADRFIERNLQPVAKGAA